MKRLLIICLFGYMSLAAVAQDEKENDPKKNLFTGGSVSLSFFDGGFLAGVNPVFGYSLTNWVDAGVLANYTYASYRDYFNRGINDKMRQSIYGGGGFLRVFPVRFLFAQAQFEHNWVRMKYIAVPGTPGFADETSTVDANSFLVGGGYCTGRDGETKSMYGYFSVMFDIVKDNNSPYVDYPNRAIPIIRAGIHVPLFQGK